MTTAAAQQTRLTAPAPTRGPAPSHSPPDTRYAPGINLARSLGYFSIGLGLAELLAPRFMENLTGVRQPGLIQVYGVREIVCGLGILSSAQPAGWLWARVAGDILDLATLAAPMAQGGEAATRAGAAGAAVAGVTLMDVACATGLTGAAAMEG